MENSGEGGDDHGSGWFEVKKKHRNNSKSVQSLVGGLSGKNSSISVCSQHPLSKFDRIKCRSCTQIEGQNYAVNVIDVGNSAPPVDGGNEGENSTKRLDKQDNGCPKFSSLFVNNTQIRTADTESAAKTDKHEVIHKIKWGDLENDDLVPCENAAGAGIKFGDVNLVPSRKHEADCELVSGDYCPNDLKNKVGEVLAVDTVAYQTVTSTPEDDGQDVERMPSKGGEVLIKKGTPENSDNCASKREDKGTELDRPVHDDESCTNSHCCEETGIAIKHEPHALSNNYGISETAEKNVLSTTVVNVSNAESASAEKSGLETSGASIHRDSVDGLHAGEKCVTFAEISNGRISSVIGEVETGESKERFRQRLWCFLFENLNRAVDELYLLCELECDLEQMKEAVLVLEEAASDFKELNSRVEEFEEVKRSSQPGDGVPISLKSDHRRPHALSWEVRRMTTSPQRAEILSSSLEVFRKIQQERAAKHAGNCSELQDHESPSLHAGPKLKNLSGIKSSAPNGKDSALKSRVRTGGSELTPGNRSGDKRNIESARSGKVNLVRNGRLHTPNTYPSDVDTSKPPVAGKCNRELLEGEENNKLPKKDNGERIQKPTDHLKRQTHPSEKDKERRNSAPWKSMDAWKEKRNWEAILSSPFRVSSRVSHSPGMSRKSAERARTLHDKLMSPEKKKKTALDLKREAEEKHARAMRIRSELENERVQKLQRTSEKLNRVNEWQAVRTMKLREGMHARQQRSESRHEAFIAQVVKRAGDESSKVNEVRFITSLNEENRKLMLHQKLHDSELRRAEKLQMIRSKQKEDLAREEAVLERRKLIEAEKLQRLAETQKKKEEAQVRREEERKASSAAREARAIEQLRRKEERAKALQEEAELLAQKLAERLSESEQRRKFYLEQIRDRASMDFRDLSSPLLRRSMSKDVQSKTTLTNNGEDHQPNNSSLEGSYLAIGNPTWQHSMKRRIKKIRQRLMSLKHEFLEPSLGSENVGIGYRTAIGTARAKIGRWLQELQKLRQARKEGAASIGLIIAEMIKYLDAKEPELQASRQAGLLDFIASALPASHTSKPETCQVTGHLLKLLRVVLSVPANQSYFLAQNLLPPIIPMLSTSLENYIKIAASITVPNNTNFPSSKTAVDNFESISEVLDGFLWTVTIIMGHISSDERQLQMWDGLLELLIAYQVIHRLRELFALYDRPQAEGLPFPSSILLSINLLVVLTSRPGTSCSIDWDSFPIETVVEEQAQKTKLSEGGNSGISGNASADFRPSSSVINGSTVAHFPEAADDKQVDITEKYAAEVSIEKDDEKEKTLFSDEKEKLIFSDGTNGPETIKADAHDKPRNNEGIPKPFICQRDEKHYVGDCVEPKIDNIAVLEQPVALLLSSICETGLVCLLSLLTAVLLQANNRMSSEQASYVLPSNFEEVATGVLKVLNNLALLDLKFIQRMLARPDLKMEFFHLMSFLLTHCTSKWKVAADQIGFLLLESLSILSHFALFHPGNQAVLRWGKSPTILHKVCDLPFVFFSDPELMPVLASTLVAACFGCEQNKSVVEQELSTDMLLSLLRSCRSLPASASHSALETPDNSGECNQQGLELRKPQVNSPMRSSRFTGRTTRVSSARPGAVGYNSKTGKTRGQRDGRAGRTEEIPSKPSLLASDLASVMLHCRLPGGFIDRAEQFFSNGATTVEDV